MSRRRIAALTLLVTTLAASPAQAQQGGDVFIGLMAGGSYSSLRGDYAEENRKYTWGFSGGATFETYFKSNFALEVDATYVQKGAGAVGTDGLETIDLDMAYLQLPVLLKVNVPLSYNWSVNFYSGISIGFQLSCDLESSGGPSTACSDTQNPGEAKSTDVAWPFGLGILYWPSGRNSGYLSFDVRYTYGLSSAFETADVKTQTLELLLRYAFKIK